MRRATDFEHLDDDGETDAVDPREAAKARAIADRRQTLVDSMREVTRRYSRLNRALTDLAQRYDGVDGVGEGAR